MIFWLVLALMTAAAVFAVLWPLSRRKPLQRGSDIAVYRDQLDEIQRDRTTGLIGDAEAEAARVEVSRRLIAAADAAEQEKPAPAQSSLWLRRVTALATIVLLPAGALTLYLTIGSPDMPGEPLASRLQSPTEANSIQEMVVKVENHLTQNPKDGHAWEVLAPIYMQLGRYDDAVRAWNNAIALNGSNGDRLASYGEALVAAANGVVTADAKSAFDDALKVDAKNVIARFYKGMAADQDGRRADAEKIWNELLAEAPAGAPWVEVVRHALARKAPSGDAALPGAPAPGANAAPPPADHDLNTMIQRLADRLKKDGSDVNGWLQLVRSWRVIGENGKMQTAVADARKALAGDADKLRQFEAGVDAAMKATPMAQPPAAPPPQASAPAAAAPGPTAADIAAAQQMKPDAQNEMIRGMVAKLADRLKTDGSDLAGWERLLRAYMVLGERSKAAGAAADARKALSSDPDKLRRLDEVIKDLKVDG